MTQLDADIRGRTHWQRAERRLLAPYAVFSAAAGVRAHPEPENLWRTCFQRDRDRIVHSAAFRRLEAKTQVFAPGRSDYYRTRLTHTIEVAQIGRTMARMLGVNEDLVEAAALAHDLGHTPYGHCGERVLDRLMQNHGGFEHNRHALRVVTYLEHPYPPFRGLNLSFETRECLAKHESRYDHATEDAAYGPGAAPLEGQIANFADAIAYNSHDLDDALAFGLIDEDALADVALYRRLRARTEAAYPGVNPVARQIRCAKDLISLLVVDVVERTRQRLADLQPPDAAAVRAAGNLLGYSPALAADVAALEKFLYECVYCHPRIRAADEQATRELEALFAWFTAAPNLLPRRYQRRVAEQGPQRVACDYIAGMTDRFCREVYQNRGRTPETLADDA